MDTRSGSVASAIPGRGNSKDEKEMTKLEKALLAVGIVLGIELCILAVLVVELALK